MTKDDIEAMRRRGLSWQEQSELCDLAIKSLTYTAPEAPSEFICPKCGVRHICPKGSGEPIPF